LSVVIAASLGILFAHQTGADAFDRAIDRPIINALAGHGRTAYWLSYAGSQVPAITTSAVIVVACLITRRFAGAILGALAVPVSSLIISDQLLKPLFDRSYLGGVTYPSGHTAAIVALITTVIVLLFLSPRASSSAGTRVPSVLRAPGVRRALGVLRVLIPAVMIVVAVGVGAGLIGLEWHYFTDIIGGAAVGVGSVCALALILDLPPIRSLIAMVGGWIRF